MTALTQKTRHRDIDMMLRFDARFSLASLRDAVSKMTSENPWIVYVPSYHQGSLHVGYVPTLGEERKCLFYDMDGGQTYHLTTKSTRWPHGPLEFAEEHFTLSKLRDPSDLTEMMHEDRHSPGNALLGHDAAVGRFAVSYHAFFAIMPRGERLALDGRMDLRIAGDHEGLIDDFYERLTRPMCTYTFGE